MPYVPFIYKGDIETYSKNLKALYKHNICFSFYNLEDRKIPDKNLFKMFVNEHAHIQYREGVSNWEDCETVADFLVENRDFRICPHSSTALDIVKSLFSEYRGWTPFNKHIEQSWLLFLKGAKTYFYHEPTQDISEPLLFDPLDDPLRDLYVMVYNQRYLNEYTDKWAETGYAILSDSFLSQKYLWVDIMNAGRKKHCKIESVYSFEKPTAHGEWVKMQEKTKTSWAGKMESFEWV